MLVVFCSQNKLKVASGVLSSTVAALACAVQHSDSKSQSAENDDSSSKQSGDIYIDNISELFREAEMQCPGCSCGFWERLGHEVSSAWQEMTTLRSSLEAEYCALHGHIDQRRELELLSVLSRGCVHVGVVLSQLLLPTDVDPVSIAETQYGCYQLLVRALHCTVGIMYISVYVCMFRYVSMHTLLFLPHPCCLG